MSLNISQILDDAIGPDQQRRKQAEVNLEQLRNQDLGTFVELLMKELGDESRPGPTRQIAGIVLKNTFGGRSYESQQANEAHWHSLGEQIKQHVRDGSMAALGSQEGLTRDVASQLVAAVGAIELRGKQWPSLIPTLCEVVQNLGAPVTARVAAIQAIGYLCDVLNAEDVDKKQSDLILTAIVAAMMYDKDDALRLSGTTALLNTLEFAKSNMEVAPERTQIMNTIVAAITTSPDPKVRTKGFECLVCIAQFYYEHLAEHISQLYEVTLTILDKDVEEVAIQAVELWSTLCDEESDIQYEIETYNEDPSRLLNFVKSACSQKPSLIDKLLECLQKQEEDQDEDSFNLAMAAGTCLPLVAQTIGDDVIPPVLDFVRASLAPLNPSWNVREAAVLAFGSILDGPDATKLQPIVRDALQMLLRMLDPSVEPVPMVRDTTAWSIGMICEFHIACLSADAFQPLVASLVNHLGDTPQVARNLCYALFHIANAFKAEADKPTNLLSQHFSLILQKLFQTTTRPDRNQHNLRGDAYEAITALIESAALDQKPTIAATLEHVLGLLAETVTKQQAGYQSKEEKDDVEGLQTHLCGALLVIVQRLAGDLTEAKYDDIMKAMMPILTHRAAPAQSDAFLVVGVVASTTGKAFMRYMAHFAPLLIAGLENRLEYQVCSTAVGVVGDICRAIEDQVTPFCDEIVMRLLNNLSDSQLNRSVKPPTLGVFGDIALAIGVQFAKYLDQVLKMLLSAAVIEANTDDEELWEYVNTLREHILEALSGILQGTNTKVPETKQQLDAVFERYFNNIVSFIGTLSEQLKEDENKLADEVVKNAGLALGDLCNVLGAKATAAIAPQAKQFEPLFKKFASLGPEERANAEWAHRQCFSS